ncbi:MAG: hypothetical protein AAFP90_05810 [Planctomycetota bacterium]
MSLAGLSSGNRITVIQHTLTGQLEIHSQLKEQRMCLSKFVAHLNVAHGILHETLP